MSRVFAQHLSGEVYVVDLDMDKPGQAVIAVCGPLHRREVTGRHEFIMNAYKIPMEDFNLDEEDVDWAEDEFVKGNFTVKSRGELQS